MKSSGRVAVVTGAARGLGRDVAHKLANDGFAVACLDLHGSVEDTTASISASGGTAIPFVCDVADEPALGDIRDKVSEELGVATVVVNVAAVLDRSGTQRTSGTAFRRSLEVNLVGPYQVTRTFLPDLLSQGWGRVVNVASIAGMRGYTYPAYAASKAGLINLTRSLLFDTWGTGVTANAVCPGAISTPMLDHHHAALMRRQIPSDRIATTGQVASVIGFLISEAASAINGAIIPVDGGATAVFRYHEAEYGLG